MNLNRLNLDYDPQDVIFLPRLIVGKSFDNSSQSSYIFCDFFLDQGHNISRLLELAL